MKVLMICGTYPPLGCGVGVYTSHLVEALGEAVDMTVLTSVEANGGPGKTLPVIPAWNWSSLGKVLQQVRQQRPNVIHLQYPTTAYRRHPAINLLPALLKLRFWRMPLIVTIHEYHDASWLGRMRTLLTAFAADHAIVSNAEDYTILKKVLPWVKWHLIYIGNNIPQIPGTAREIQTLLDQIKAPQKPYALYFGHVYEAKGIHNLLTAISTWPKELNLILAGHFEPGDPYHEQLALQIKSLNGRVVWASDMNDHDSSLLMQASELGVLPFEQPASLRRSTLLALCAHGLPTITTGPVREPLHDHDNCIVLPNNEPATISTAVTELFNDASLRTMMRVNTLKLANMFDWVTIANEHQNVYNEVVSAGTPRRP